VSQLDNPSSCADSEFENRQATKVVGKKSAYVTQRNENELASQEPLFFWDLLILQIEGSIQQGRITPIKANRVEKDRRKYGGNRFTPWGVSKSELTRSLNFCRKCHRFARIVLAVSANFRRHSCDIHISVSRYAGFFRNVGIIVINFINFHLKKPYRVFTRTARYLYNLKAGFMPGVNRKAFLGAQISIFERARRVRVSYVDDIDLHKSRTRVLPVAEYRKINGALFGRQVSEAIPDAPAASRRQ